MIFTRYQFWGQLGVNSGSNSTVAGRLARMLYSRAMSLVLVILVTNNSFSTIKYEVHAQRGKKYEVGVLSRRSVRYSQLWSENGN